MMTRERAVASNGAGLCAGRFRICIYDNLISDFHLVKVDVNRGLLLPDKNGTTVGPYSVRHFRGCVWMCVRVCHRTPPLWTLFPHEPSLSLSLSLSLSQRVLPTDTLSFIERVVPTDRLSFIVCQSPLLLLSRSLT